MALNIVAMDDEEVLEARRLAEQAHALASDCRAALFGSRNGGATPEAVNSSLAVRMACLEEQVEQLKAEIATVRRVAAQLQAAGALVGAAVVGLQLVTLAMKLGAQ